MSINGIKTTATYGRRIHNEREVEAAIKKDTAKRSRTACKQAPAKDSSDPAVIMAFAEARGCPELGKAWLVAGLGTLGEFKAVLAARHDRLNRLFPGGAVK
jgi:hypothetical protein